MLNNIPLSRRMMRIAHRRRFVMRTMRDEISIGGVVVIACPIRHNNRSHRMPAVATLHTATNFSIISQPSFPNNSSCQQLLSRQNHHPYSQTIAARRSMSSNSVTSISISSSSSSSSNSTTSSSSVMDDHSTNKSNHNKPWLDPQRTLSSRVEALVHDSPWIHPAEFRVDSNLHELLLECCRLQSLQGQQMAQEVMERLLLEKTRLHQQQQQSSLSSFRRQEPSASSSTTTTPAVVVVYIPERFWQNLIFGWSKLAGKLRVARLHMKENLQSAIDAAKEDYRRDQERMTLSSSSSSSSAAAAAAAAANNDEDYDDRNGGRSSEPTLELFNTYLLGLSRAARIGAGAAMQAESALFDMMEYHDQFGWHTKPNTRSYTHVINAHVNSRHKTAGGRALDILNHVKQTHQAEKLAYLDRFGIAYQERGPNHPRIVTPDGIMYTSVMMAMLNSRNMSARRVVELLHEFLDLAKSNNNNNNDDETIQVDASHFTVAIRALGNEIERINNAAQRVKLAQQAESILNLMFEYMAQKKQKVAMIDKDKQKEEEEEDVQFQKALYAFNACLDAWGRAYAQEAALRCEDLLKEMLDKSINTTNNIASTEVVGNGADDVVVEPDTVSFNSCLQAWSKAHSFYPDAAYRANELLDLFCHLHTSGLVKKGPDLQSWTITILALQHVTPLKSSGDGDNSNDNNNTASSSSSGGGAIIVRRARRLLEAMLDSVQNQSTQISRNLAGPFTAVIRVAAKMADADSTLVRQNAAAKMGETSRIAKEETIANGKDASDVDSLLFGENVDHPERHAEDDEADDMDPYSIACRTYREVVDDLYNLKDRQRTKNRVDQNNNHNNEYNDGDSSSSSNVGHSSDSSSSSSSESGTSSSSGIADHHTFAAMLTCIDRYNPHPTSSERKTFGNAVFADACQAGQVSRVVLHEAAVVLQIPAAVEVDGTKNEIPRFWYRNVEGSWRPK